jgi:hypothetical protein
MTEPWKFLAEKMAVPILVAVVGAALVAYFVSERRANLMLERVVVADSTDQGINGLGSWYLRSVSAQQRHLLAPLVQDIARKSEENGDERFRSATERTWPSRRIPNAALDTTWGVATCAGLGAAALRPAADPLIWPRPGQEEIGPDHPLFGRDYRTNSLQASLYSLDWNLDETLAMTVQEVMSRHQIPRDYTYPTDSILASMEAPEEQVALTSDNPEVRCTALRWALMQRLYEVSRHDDNWKVSGPILDLTFRNSGRQGATITAVSASPVWSSAHGCDAGGSPIIPVVAPVVLPINPDQRTSAHLDVPISLNGGDSTRVQVSIDLSEAERGCGTRIVFDMALEYFDGFRTRSMFVGRFAIGTLVGNPI